MNYNWQPHVLEVKLIDGTLENVIKTVHWRYAGTDENGNTAYVYGALQLPLPNEEKFIAFEQMTNEEVNSWLESILDVESLQENITSQIDKIVNPEIFITTLQ